MTRARGGGAAIFLPGVPQDSATPWVIPCRFPKVNVARRARGIKGGPTRQARTDLSSETGGTRHIQKVGPGERDRHSASLAEVSPFAAGAGRWGGQKPLAALRSSGPTVGTDQRLDVIFQALVWTDWSRAESSAKRVVKTRRAVSSAASDGQSWPLLKGPGTRLAWAGGLHAKCSRRRRQANPRRHGTRGAARRASALATLGRAVRHAQRIRRRPQGRAFPGDDRPAASADASVRDSLRERNLR